MANVDVFAVALPPMGGAVEAGKDPSSDDDSQTKENVWEKEHFLKNGEDDSTLDKESVEVPPVESVLHGEWNHVSTETCIT